MNRAQIIKELDYAINSLNKPDYDISKIARVITNTCEFIKVLIEEKEKEVAELEEEVNDLDEAMDALIEQNEIMQVDLQVILEFMQKSGIDITYIVTRSDIAKKVKGKSPE